MAAAGWFDWLWTSAADSAEPTAGTGGAGCGHAAGAASTAATQQCLRHPTSPACPSGRQSLHACHLEGSFATTCLIAFVSLELVQLTFWSQADRQHSSYGFGEGSPSASLNPWGQSQGVFLGASLGCKPQGCISGVLNPSRRTELREYITQLCFPELTARPVCALARHADPRIRQKMKLRRDCAKHGDIPRLGDAS